MHLITGLYHNTPLNTSEMPQDSLNIEDKIRSNPLPWNGQFSPQLVNRLLRNYAESDMVILDPFVGSGTALLEAGRLGLKAFGSEINPAAVAMSKVYQFINLPLNERQLCLVKANSLLDKQLQEALS
jgi:DNA modification methylase